MGLWSAAPSAVVRWFGASRVKRRRFGPKIHGLSSTNTSIKRMSKRLSLRELRDLSIEIADDAGLAARLRNRAAFREHGIGTRTDDLRFAIREDVFRPRGFFG